MRDYSLVLPMRKAKGKVTANTCRCAQALPDKAGTNEMNPLNIQREPNTISGVRDEIKNTFFLFQDSERGSGR